MKTKTQTEKHTPTQKEKTKMPLKIGGIMNMNGDSTRRIDEADGMVVAFVTDQNLIDGTKRDEVAACIVRAVNSHETLLDALKKIRSRYKGGDTLDACLSYSDANEAIAKAEGGK